MEPTGEMVPAIAVPVEAEREYQAVLSSRQVQMIAFGGAIGVGLFLGTAQRLHDSGPGLVFSYVLAGLAAFFVMRALGELVLHDPAAGSFVAYAREFIGPWAGFASGWMYWLNWAMTGVAEITAVGIYVHFWLPAVPQWVSALVALGALLTVNLVSVRLFGELEFWFASLKVVAIVVFLGVALALVVTGGSVGHHTAGYGNISGHGGWLPMGLGVVLMSLQSVVFAYSGIEMVGVTAGETKDPRRVLPKAVSSVIWRIAIFYVGSVLLLVLVLPWTVYTPGQSPFVTFFAALGVPAAGGIMNLVVLTAAMSSCNSGLYSTGRVLKALADSGEAPRFTGRLSSRHVPYGGIALTAAVYLAGVGLNAVVPHDAFEIATAVASLGVLSTWAVLLLCQTRLRERQAFRMPGSPVTNWLTLGFLALVVVLMAFDASQRIAVYCLPVVALALVIGWRAVAPRRPRAPSR